MEFLQFIGDVAVRTSLIWYRGFVLTLLWSWFVLTLFPSAPSLTTAHAIGLILISMLTFGVRYVKSEEEQTLLNTFARSTTVTTLALSIGFVVKQFL